MGESVSVNLKPCDNILSALARSGFSLTAPCGGRGICRKCRVVLTEGKVNLIKTGEQVKPGDSFCACRAEALSDITVLLPCEENKSPSLAVIPDGRKIRSAGIGIDIGTTTINAELVDLETGESLDFFSALNDQRTFGADVMSRIGAARDGKTKELFLVVNRQVEGMLRFLIDKWGVAQIEQCAVSGNTVMLHLFAGVDPYAMGEAPYTPVFLEERHFSGKELSLSAESVTLLPGFSAFVGADITAGLAFIDVIGKNENALFVDIGTNGEIALWKNSSKQLFCCSTAVGPCFEGAEISCGIGAVPGAINRISFKKTEENLTENAALDYTTIGNEKARGICGAGLIDVMAIMKRLCVIDETGAMDERYAQHGFSVTERIVITQRDVRQFQLAKAAICSGIKILCKTAGMKLSDVDTAYIAGGLGFFINLENAAETGLLPPEITPKTAVCGNTSLKGAVKSLTDRDFLPRCREIISRSTVVDLALDRDFTEEFAENMEF